MRFLLTLFASDLIGRFILVKIYNYLPRCCRVQIGMALFPPEADTIVSKLNKLSKEKKKEINKILMNDLGM